MPRPIETLLSLPRLRLFVKIPIPETERLLKRFIDSPQHRLKLLKPALEVSAGSAQQFSSDWDGLASLLKEIDSAEYVLTKRSKIVMETMLSDICDDGALFKEFEEQIRPLCDLSQNLLQVSMYADSLADRAKEGCIDVARALLIGIPRLDT